MKTKLRFIRSFKRNFLRFGLDWLTEPFAGAMINLAYMGKLSRFRKKHNNPGFNDFFNPKWDYNSRYSLYEYLLKKEGLEGPVNYLEFGVAEGKSLKWWVENSKHPDSTFHGFDTFTGLPEDWNVFKAGAMSTGGKLPDINDERVTFYKGLFQDTFPDFLQSFDTTRRCIFHMDADLYTSTLFVLTSAAPYMKPGDLILFDEFTVPQHEYLAFKNFTESFRIDFEVIAAANNYYFLAVKLK